MKTIWKWILLAALLIGLIAGASVLYDRLSGEYEDGGMANSEETESQEDERFAAPDFTVFDENGNEVKLSDFKGQPVVLNFWATWCYYCKTEMPDFDKAREAYPDVQFLMVNVTDGMRETVDIAKAYVEQEQFEFDVFYDTAFEAADAYYVTSLPCTYFIDSDGCLVTRANGALNYAKLEKGIAMIAK